MVLSYSASARYFVVIRNDCFLRLSELMQEKVSSASFALFGRKYLQPSSHVPAGTDDNNLFFLGNEAVM